jgi:hypothetical protein
MSKVENWVTSRRAHLKSSAAFSRFPPRAGSVQRAIRNITILTNGQQQQSALSGEVATEAKRDLTCKCWIGDLGYPILVG